jgi:hypothetical protein
MQHYFTVTQRIELNNLLWLLWHKVKAYRRGRSCPTAAYFISEATEKSSVKSGTGAYIKIIR